MAVDVFVVRRGVAPPTFFGHLVRVPPVPTPEELEQAGVGRDAASLSSVEEALFADTLAGIGRPRQVVPYGLVEPTPWERRFVAWVARRLGRDPAPGWDRLPATRNDRMESVAAALADPLAPSPPADAPVRLLGGDDVELEALGAAREIRRWLEAQPAPAWSASLDDVLVLLPGAGERRSTWRRALARQGLPCGATESTSLREAPLGQWLLALARLARWSRDHRARREDLRVAVLAPFVSLPQGARRADLRTALRSLRVHRVTGAEWEAHLAHHFEQARAVVGEDEDLDRAEREERLAQVDERAKGLAELGAVLARLADERAGAAFPRILDALCALRAAERVRASGVETRRAHGGARL